MVGKTDRGFIAEGTAHFLERLSHWSKVQEVVVPRSTRQEAQAQVAEECSSLLKAIPEGARVVALDETGKGMDSRALAAQLGKWRDASSRECVLLIGGAYGLNDAVRQRADLVLSLSQMTFTHQLVRLVLAEQLYRAWSILNKSGYHH